MHFDNYRYMLASSNTWYTIYAYNIVHKNISYQDDCDPSYLPTYIINKENFSCVILYLWPVGYPFY